MSECGYVESPEEQSARVLGRCHGCNAAQWYFDARNTDEWSVSVTLRGIEDGDPMILDTFPTSPLSGEWADAFSLADLARELDMDVEDEGFDDVVRAYEDGFSEGVHDTIENTCRSYLKGCEDEDDDFPPSGGPVSPERFAQLAAEPTLALHRCGYCSGAAVKAPNADYPSAAALADHLAEFHGVETRPGFRVVNGRTLYSADWL